MKTNTAIFLGVAVVAVVGGYVWYSKQKALVNPPPAVINPQQRNPNNDQQATEIGSYVSAGSSALDTIEGAFGGW